MQSFCVSQAVKPPLPLAVLQGDERPLPARSRALILLATTLTEQPWALDREIVAEVGRHGLDGQQLEAAVVVVSIFNYYTRVADASGIEFDYETPLPAFEPDLSQAAAPRPDQPSPAGADALPARRELRYPPAAGSMGHVALLRAGQRGTD